jgi:hypothetical protein
MRTLQIFQDAVKSYTKCELHVTRNNTVFSRGNPQALNVAHLKIESPLMMKSICVLTF